MSKSFAKEYIPLFYWEGRASNYSVSMRGQNQIEIETIFLLDLYRSITEDKKLTVLDIGSGYGRLLKRFRREGIDTKITMCDISKMFASIVKKETGLSVDLWNGNTLPYKDQAFDVVVSFDVLLHVLKLDIKQVWKEHLRVAKDFIFIATAEYNGKPNFSHCVDHDYKDLLKMTDNFEVLIWKKWENNPKRLDLWLRRKYAD